jgi:hypothetical protein
MIIVDVSVTQQKTASQNSRMPGLAKVENVARCQQAKQHGKDRHSF